MLRDSLEGVACDEKGFVTDPVRENFFKCQRNKTENRVCFDCSSRQNSWVSLTYGIYLCIQCSAVHRRYGTHISFVRSADLDKFTRDQLRVMQIGGNGRALAFFKNHGLIDGRVDYSSRIAVLYRRQLQKEVQEWSDHLNGIRSDIEGVDHGDSAEGAPDPVNVASSSTKTPQPQPSSRPLAVTIPPPSRVVAKKLDFEFDFEDAVNDGSASKTIDELPKYFSPMEDRTYGGVSPLRTSKTLTSDTRQYARRDFYSTAEVVPPHATENASASAVDSRFAGAKAISSANYFGQNQNPSDIDRMALRTTMARHANATAISSESLFGPAEPQSGRALDEDTIDQLNMIENKLRGAVNKISRTASGVVNKAQSWLQSNM